ncbi:MAG: FHA domain-containing protein [Deltaproteobacteria bacterium]|nr:FHA domain-containing protein [Deltaproteobacteria bacterium]
MARLILMFNNQVVKEYPLLKDSITIGRNEDNIITVDNLAVSGYHARIDAAGKDYILTDLQSTNGTFVNDKKVISHKLVHGDNVIVGKHLILFVGEGKEAPAVKAPGQKMDMDKTMMLDTAKQKELLAKQAGTAAAADTSQKLGVISFIEGADLGEIELTKKLTKIGKADTSEIKLTGIFMPATAATISRRPSGYVITAMGTKIKVNGEVIKDAVQLKEFDTIEIGKVKFQFYQKGGDK